MKDDVYHYCHENTHPRAKNRARFAAMSNTELADVLIESHSPQIDMFARYEAVKRLDSEAFQRLLGRQQALRARKEKEGADEEARVFHLAEQLLTSGKAFVRISKKGNPLWSTASGDIQNWHLERLLDKLSNNARFHAGTAAESGSPAAGLG